MKDRKIVAICGGSASGKTFIAEELCKRNPREILLISQDSYYRSFDELTVEEKKKTNYDHPDAFDIQLLIQNVIKLKNGECIENPVYSFSEYTRTGTIKTFPKKIILIEGMLALHYPELRNLIDKSVFIDCSERLRLKRMIERDIIERGRTLESVVEQYKRDMRPMHEKYVEPQKQYADIIIDGSNNKNTVYREIETFLDRSNILDGIER